MHTVNQMLFIRKTLHGLILFAILFSAFNGGSLSTATAQQAGTATPQGTPLPGVDVSTDPIPLQMAIRFNPGTTDDKKLAYVKSINARIIERIDPMDTFIVEFNSELSASADIASPIVEISEPDYYVSALDDVAPNDPRYAEQWALTAIGAPSAWVDILASAPKVTVAVIDSGICTSHPDLVGRIAGGYDFVQNDATPQDDFGHGCSAAGIIAANMNNEIGIAGVAPNAQIMPLRVLDASGIGSYSNVAAAIVYAADHGAQVINLSLGGSNTSATLESAVNYAISKGVTLVAAAGNSGTQGALYPAAYPNVVAVGSIDRNMQHSTFSNYGSQIDIWAPGRDILTTKLDGGYGLVSGTSFAAPYVAGAEAVEIARGKSVSLNAGILSLTDVQTTATVTSTPAITATPTLTQLPTIAPTLTGLNPADAGTGSMYRAQVRVRQATDLKRLQKWDVTVLDQSSGFAVVQVTPEQLSKLARLGFEPMQIDSVEYMLTAKSLMSGKVLSLADVTASSFEMLALASVDSDSDGLTDTEESWWCTNPVKANSDHSEAASTTDPNDGNEVNNILKGITSYGPPFEMWPNFKPYHADGTCPDGDFDGVPDNAELYMIGTSPMRESSDLDKFDDGQELFGVTFCPGTSGPCGYGILPRAEDTAFVSANMPAWVQEPGNSPFVAAFPEPEVEVASSSIVITQKTVITNTKGTTVGTEKTYGTSSTKGLSKNNLNNSKYDNLILKKTNQDNHNEEENQAKNS